MLTDNVSGLGDGLESKPVNRKLKNNIKNLKMKKKVIINAKADPALREAIRIVAFKEKTTRSKIILKSILRYKPIKKEYEALQHD